MRLVHQDDVEEVSCELAEPPIVVAGKLMNIGDGKVAVREVVTVHATGLDYSGLGILLACGKDTAPLIEVVGELVPDPKARRNHQGSSGVQRKRCQCD
ncbi:hypothetical protein OUZ56_032578 [Daphnia magna]|uniref:Uncharacterized protein n=1 Tax=Daphnia magna TaxID=35525 RepID=A0ABR0B9B3_9CRUS|nr:hypothetical protein OUZ56_032578 [Daphnia magna]